MLAPVITGLVVFGAAIPWLVVALMTLAQRLTPALQGRVFAAVGVLITTPQTLSIALGAALITVVGYQVLLAAMAAVFAATAVSLLTRPEQRRPRHLDAEQPAFLDPPTRQATSDGLVHSSRLSEDYSGGIETQGRKKDSAATKSALLSAARELFTERGYERATVRDIAARAGTNQSLLFRYFGSKDELFRAVVAELTQEVLAEGPAEELPARLLTLLLVPDDKSGLGNWLQAAFLSTGHDESVSAIRDLSERYQGVLCTLTGAADGGLRADLVVAWFLGIALMRSVYRPEPLTGADPAAVAGHVLSATSTLLERTDLRFPAR